jgi:hypothetical protein
MRFRRHIPWVMLSLLGAACGNETAKTVVGASLLGCAKDAASACAAFPCLEHLADEVKYVCGHPAMGLMHLEIDQGATETFVELDLADGWVRSVYDSNGLLVGQLDYDANTEVTSCDVGPEIFNAAEALATPTYQDMSGDALRARCAGGASDAGADASD